MRVEVLDIKKISQKKEKIYISEEPNKEREIPIQNQICIKKYEIFFMKREGRNIYAL